MKSSSFGRYALCAGVAAALVAGCGALRQAQDDMLPGAQPGAPAAATHVVRGASWMLPEAKREGLLYVADITMQEVWVFSYPQGKLIGDLTGSAWPAGECVDEFGDVFVTDYLNAKILEYPHGGTQPLKTLDDPGYLPGTCSVDRITGDLAVTNLKREVRTGSIAIYGAAVYKRSLGKPREIADPHFRGFISCTYDDKGNLFVDGIGPKSLPDPNRQFAELTQGSRELKSITLPKDIDQIGPLQWDRGYVTMGGSRGGLKNARQIIHRLEISGDQAKSAGSTSLDNVVLGGAYFIDSNRVVTPDADMPRIQIFDYPSGGQNLEVIQRKFGEPVQTVISHGRH